MNLFVKTSLVLLFITISIGCNNEKKTSITKTKFGEVSVISPLDFKTKSEGNIVIDIRTPREFSDGHIEGAKNINFFDKSFSDEISKFNKSEPIFLYCRSGNRSYSASKKLENLGFEKIYDLQGGIMNWAKNKQKIVK